MFHLNKSIFNVYVLQTVLAEDYKQFCCFYETYVLVFFKSTFLNIYTKKIMWFNKLKHFPLNPIEGLLNN